MGIHSGMAMSRVCRMESVCAAYLHPVICPSSHHAALLFRGAALTARGRIECREFEDKDDEIEETTTGETEKLVDSGDVPNFASRVFRSSLFMFSNLCIGYSSIILAPWLIRVYKAGQGAEDEINNDEECSKVVQGNDFLILTVVTGISNIVGRLIGIFLWDRVKFLYLQSTVTIVVALSFVILLLKPSFTVSMAFLGLSKFCYSVQAVEVAILHFDYDYYGKFRFELGSCISAASSMIGAVFGTSLSAFLDPYLALTVLLMIACCEIFVICFMRERF